MTRTAAVFAAVASASVPAAVSAAPWAAPDAPAPLGTQFLVSLALMAVSGFFVVRETFALVRERKRRRAARRPDGDAAPRA